MIPTSEAYQKLWKYHCLFLKELNETVIRLHAVKKSRMI